MADNKVTPVNGATANGIMYVPIAQYAPAFANVAPVEAYHGIPGDIASILTSANTLQIRQHVKVLPKRCCSCPPCVQQENTYSVYAGFDRAEANEFLRVDEVSNDWNRCCCAPYHPLKLEVRQYIPPPGASNVASDMNNVMGDLTKDWGNLGKNEQAKAMHDVYARYPPLFTIQRDGGMRCCYKCPCKVLSTCVCMACCADGAKVYAGALPDHEEKGLPVETSAFVLGSILQPIFGGVVKPELHVYGEGGHGVDNAKPYGRIRGPFCFGGWSEMCCDFKFITSFMESDSDAGDIAIITKKKPQSLAGAAQELFSSNADNYSIDFKEGGQFNIAQKTSILAAQILADYMWFDGNTEKCKMENDACTCYLCYFSCIGLLVPCYIKVPYGSSS